MPASKKKFAEHISAGIENFSNSFYKILAAEHPNENIVCSALSAHLVLSLAAYGADGSTAEEMRRTLNLPEFKDEVQACDEFRNIIKILGDSSGAAVQFANQIYAAKTTVVKEKFNQLANTYFYSKYSALDFSKSEEAAKTINQWCHDKTQGKIRELVLADDIVPNLSMVLLNAVYFKATWLNQFDPEETVKHDFHVNDTTIIEAPTMTLEKYIFYKDLEDLDAKCVALPYEDFKFAMLIVVPNRIGDLQNLEKHVEKIKFDYETEIREQICQVRLQLPKFKIETTADLNKQLREMGMNQMFSDQANFTRMTETPVRVEKVRQKAFIEVNETGTEAAAVTACFGTDMIFIADETPPLLVCVDRPFFYKILYENTTLFSGHIIKPEHS